MSRPLRVLLGVCGGIAAYKTPDLVRRLAERGHAVRCALTRGAESFVAPLSLEIVTGHAVYRQDYLEPNGSGEELHIEAARWAELILIAPATANTLARLALGLCDDFLTTTCAAFDGPLVAAPAMSSVMWSRPALRGHVETLRRRGVTLVGPDAGPLASGDSGVGRLADPAAIAAAIEAVAGGGELAGRTVVIAAGPTREPLDAVRFLSNRSSGKMGYALAAEAARRGARVLLVSGPVTLPTPPGVERIDVETAAEMEHSVHGLAPDADLVVMAAAVADFRPRAVAAGKLKKRDGVPRLELEATADILAGLARVAPGAVRVGFAAETGALEEEAAAKLAAKDLDLIVANDVSRADVGFGSDDNEVVVLRRGAAPKRFDRRPKRRLAADLMDLFADALERHDATHPARSG